MQIAIVPLAAALGVLTLAGDWRSSSVEDTVASLRDAKAECAYLQTLCNAARSAKRDVQQAGSLSRGYHARARASTGERTDEETRVQSRREGHDVQERLTASSQRRFEAARAYEEAVDLVTRKRGMRPACAVCPGISDD